MECVANGKIGTKYRIGEQEAVVVVVAKQCTNNEDLG